MRSVRTVFLILLSVLFIGVVLVVYAFKIEPNLLMVHSYQLGDKKSSRQLRIVQVSDIQIGDAYPEENLDRIAKKINALSPDVIVLTGDLYEYYAAYDDGHREAIVEKLSHFRARLGKYAVWGNRDYGGGAQNAYPSILEDCGFTLLENEGVNLDVDGDKKIFLGGVDDVLLGTPDVDAALAERDGACDYSILMVHEPDVADTYADYPIDLILSGHSHGGQVQIPFFEGIRTSMAEKYIRHFYTINEGTGMQLYVNTGIGTSRMPVRFGVVPEIAVFDIGL